MLFLLSTYKGSWRKLEKFKMKSAILNNFICHEKLLPFLIFLQIFRNSLFDKTGFPLIAFLTYKFVSVAIVYGLVSQLNHCIIHS